MKIPEIRLCALCAFLASTCAGAALADKPAADSKSAAKPKPAKDKSKYTKPVPTNFLRVLRNDKKVPTRLETSVVRYVPADGKGELVVDLVGAVHIGDKTYYDDLNKRFESYDVVLYELVAPKGTRIGKDERNDSAFGKAIKNLLDLESQVQKIDYTKKNLVHADMSPSEMAEAMKKRGDTGFSLVMSVFSDLMKQQNVRMKQMKKDGRKIPQISLATLLFDPNKTVKLKRYMAEEFDSQDPSGALGQTLNRMLIVDRNKAAMKVLDEQVKKGTKKIAIFYGAAHMPDFETRLLVDFGLKRKSVEWVTAWDIKE